MRFELPSRSYLMDAQGEHPKCVQRTLKNGTVGFSRRKTRAKLARGTIGAY